MTTPKAKTRPTQEQLTKLHEAADRARERCSKRNATRSSLHGLVGRSERREEIWTKVFTQAATADDQFLRSIATTVADNALQAYDQRFPRSPNEKDQV